LQRDLILLLLESGAPVLVSENAFQIPAPFDTLETLMITIQWYSEHMGDPSRLYQGPEDILADSCWLLETRDSTNDNREEDATRACRILLDLLLNIWQRVKSTGKKYKIPPVARTCLIPGEFGYMATHTLLKADCPSKNALTNLLDMFHPNKPATSLIRRWVRSSKTEKKKGRNQAI
jgi:hypothetical protein